MNKADAEQLTKTLSEQLQAQTKEWLIKRLCEFAVDDNINADRIFLYLSAEISDEGKIIIDFKSIIDKAIKHLKDHGHAYWRNKLPRRALYDIADALAEVSLKSKQNAVLEIAEYMLLGLDAVSELQDECELDWLIETFRNFHIGACCKLKPEPQYFGTHLAQLANKTEWGLFKGPPAGYAEVLGAEGLSSYAAALKNRR